MIEHASKPEEERKKLFAKAAEKIGKGKHPLMMLLTSGEHYDRYAFNHSIEAFHNNFDPLRIKEREILTFLGGKSGGRRSNATIRKRLQEEEGGECGEPCMISSARVLRSSDKKTE
jgi:hypothetical protein